MDNDGSRLIEQVLNEGLSPHRRLAAIRELIGTRERASPRVRALLSQLATDLEVDPMLAYVAGVGLARTAELSSSSLASLSREALLGWSSERERSVAREEGTFVDFRRMSDSQTRRFLRMARDARYPLEARSTAIVALGDASEDEEPVAIDFLAQLAQSPHLSPEITRAAGIGFARLLIRQGVFHTELTALFSESALQAYLEEASRIRSA